MTQTKDITIAEKGPLAIARTEDVRHGGMSSEDLEIPRAAILQALSPDVLEGGLRAGTIINSITKETLGDKFLALFPFKQYVKFNEDGKVEWKTIDRLDPRVEEGLKWVGDNKPTVTEYINVLALFQVGGEWDTTMPLILSFKKTSLRVGRQFSTLLALAASAGKPAYSAVYSIKTSLKQDGPKSWYMPKVVPVATKDCKVAKEVIEAAASFTAQFKPMIHQMPAEVVDPEQDQA